MRTEIIETTGELKPESPTYIIKSIPISPEDAKDEVYIQVYREGMMDDLLKDIPQNVAGVVSEMLDFDIDHNVYYFIVTWRPKAV